MNELIGTNLGQYQIIEVIGRGSSSTVYKAYQPSLNRYVAVKVLLRNVDPQFVARFQREAHAIGQLQHPNILPIYDYGHERGVRYFVMQYVENGLTLADVLSGALEPRRALRLMYDVLDALAYAHARGVIHRDIKPSNILMPSPIWPMLADFGIAKSLDDSKSLTPPGQAVGTAMYMAPERANNQPADARTDLYSAGVVLYELLTGQVPFVAATPVAVLLKHAHEPPPAPRSLNPQLPASLEAVLLRALEKDPAARYQSAAEMAEDLKRVSAQIERALEETRRFYPPPAVKAADPYKTGKLAPLDEPGLAAPMRPEPQHSVSAAARTPTQNTSQRRLPAWLIGLALGLGALVGLALPAGLLSSLGRQEAAAPTSSPVVSYPTVLGSAPIPQPSPTGAAPTSAPAQDVFEPTVNPQATEVPLATEPTPIAQLPPTSPPDPVQPTAPLTQAGVTGVRLEDTDWQGGYRSASGRPYGGRTATWIYGSATEYNTMRAAFELGGQPVGQAVLSVEGMDSEGPAKTLISIRVNEVEIYRGPNLLPDDDIPLETGTWATASWQFDAALLRPGRNEISISNLDPGAFSLPPFFMLDYADLSYELPAAPSL